MNPYGICHHTKYEGCPPCIHSAWEEGVQAARDAVAALSPMLDVDKYRGGYDCCGCSTTYDLHHDSLAAIDGLRGEA